MGGNFYLFLFETEIIPSHHHPPPLDASLPKRVREKIRKKEGRKEGKSLVGAKGEFVVIAHVSISPWFFFSLASLAYR